MRPLCLAIWLVPLVAAVVLAADNFNVKSVIDLAAQQYEKLVSQIQLGYQYPTHGVPSHTHWAVNNHPTATSVDWTDGFFPGILWQLYNYTRHDKWKGWAIKATHGLEQQQYNVGTHDIGFLVLCSFGEGFILTADKTYPGVIINAANHLAKRFNKKVGCLRSWGRVTEAHNFLVIVDNMMNLELLFAAHKLKPNESLVEIAISHANRTAVEHIRADGSSFHVVDFNQTTGKVHKKYTAQGYSDNSCWSRGQAWLVTGFARLYGHTRMPHFLATAEHVAAYFIAHLPSDGIPSWDFGAPHDAHHPYVPRDVSAGAIASVGLFELYGHTHNKTYLNTAHRIVRSLGTAKYLVTGHKQYHLPALLTNSTISKAATQPELSDQALIYADYYYLKALSYLQKYPMNHQALEKNLTY